MRRGFYAAPLCRPQAQQEQWRQVLRGVASDGLAVQHGVMVSQPFNPLRDILHAADATEKPRKRPGRKPANPLPLAGDAKTLSSLLPDHQPHHTAAAAAGQIEILPPLLPMEGRDLRKIARGLHFQGYRPDAIVAMLGITINQFRMWKSRGNWDDISPLVRVEMAVETRLQNLIALPSKTGSDYKEIDLLMRQMERSARIQKYNKTGKEGDLNPNIDNRKEGTRAYHRKRKAEEEAAPGLKGAITISQDQADIMRKEFEDTLFDYQRTWFDAGGNRIRHILKSRQIGATFYFAREALLDAIDTGRNQIFLSASKAQAHVFKHYMQQLASVADVELKGEVIKLANGAHLYFLGTNSKTAQSYHGNLYFDEIFWVGKFQELRKVASGMAIHKRWRQTYVSTPSSITHEAYPFWKGDLFNRRRAVAERVEIDVSHTALAGGKLCADGQWRQIVTVEDALAGGCDLFDLDQLRLEYGEDEYRNLLMCEFVDDTDSVFPFSMLSNTMVDSWDAWERDYKPFAQRPLGDKPVWIGYDPSRSADGAGLVVLAAPEKAGGKFRLVERHRYQNVDFAGQAAAIRALTARYNVKHIAIDDTGLGRAVYELVLKFYPRTVALRYDIELKTKLVLKTLDVMRKGRLEMDASMKDVISAFMTIRRVMTPSGQQLTYKSGRSEENGHADLAWACMNALINEPLQGEVASGGSTMEIY